MKQQFSVSTYLVNHYREIDSTQDEVKRLIDKSLISNNQIIIADLQTKGRGRYNRTWQTDVGNFACSICFAGNVIIKPEHMCYIAGMSIHETISTFNVEDLKLKWVNDLLLKGKKLAGILLEQYKNQLILGIGCNLNNFKDMQNLNATSLSAEGVKVSNIDFLNILLPSLERNIQHYQSFGFKKCKNYWLDHALNIGSQITVKSLNEEHVGIFKTIDDEGKLVLENNEKCLSISAGELFNL